MSTAPDFSAHNEAVRQVWEAYHAGQPTRVPLLFTQNPRFSWHRPDGNPRGITYEQYWHDPQLMLERLLEHQEWIRFNLVHDAEMGWPAEGWDVGVSFWNAAEAGWWGCLIFFSDDQIPDTSPILSDDNKRMLFDQGLPDFWTGGLMARNWEYYEYFKEKRREGFTWKGLPLRHVSAAGAGTNGVLTLACELRGAGEFITDLIEDPDYAMELMDFLTEATIERTRAYAGRLGWDWPASEVWIMDDSIQLISTRMYEEMIYPFHRKYVDALAPGGKVSMHLCGDATRHFPLLVEKMGVRSFDTGFPVDFIWLRETLGPEVEICGGPSVPFLRNATPEETVAETRRVLESGIMRGGRFILREGNNLAPEIPMANLHAMYDTVKQWGRYQ